MRATMYALALLAVAVGTGVTLAQPQTDFEYACEQIENMYPDYSCDGLKPPTIVVSSLVDDLSWGRLNGAYVPGEPYIFINPYGTNPAKTIIHETVHYIIHNLGILERHEKCKHEEIARFIAGQDVPWRSNYGCELPEGEEDETSSSN